MFAFGIIIILAFSILLLAEFINEIMHSGISQSLASMVDKLDELIDKVTDKWHEK